jgi:NADH:ubiquinone oxidoreductase subunit 6 (subunit J)
LLAAFGTLLLVVLIAWGLQLALSSERLQALAPMWVWIAVAAALLLFALALAWRQARGREGRSVAGASAELGVRLLRALLLVLGCLGVLVVLDWLGVFN